MPQDEYWLASFEVMTPKYKLAFPWPKKKIGGKNNYYFRFILSHFDFSLTLLNSHYYNELFRIIQFLLKNSGHHFPIFFGRFLDFFHADLDSREQHANKRSYSTGHAKCEVFL